MAKRLVSQVKSVWAASGILSIGASRFQQKQDARALLMRLGQGATSSQLAKLTNVTSYRTYDAYRGVSVEFARFTEHAFGVRRVADLRPDHAEAFIRAKLAAGASCNTLRTAAAALAKFDSALARCPRKMHIPPEARLRHGLEAVRAEFNATAPRLDTERRAFFEPKAVVAAVEGQTFQIVARLQLEAGFRVSEIQGLKPSDLRGLAWDPVSGTRASTVHVRGKGGFERVQFVPVNLYARLAEHLRQTGSLDFDYGRYLQALKDACASTGEIYTGSHALRHSYIQAFVLSAAATGRLSAREVQREAMERVGHHRESELSTYFR